jgi:hypothetical protein
VEVLPELPPCELLRTQHIVASARHNFLEQAKEIDMAVADTRFGVEVYPSQEVVKMLGYRESGCRNSPSFGIVFLQLVDELFILAGPFNGRVARAR